jgi:hypothetical protein
MVMADDIAAAGASPGASSRAAVSSALAPMADDQALVGRRKLLMAKLLGGVTLVMVTPPVLAGVFGSLGLAVATGVLSIFAGLAGMSIVVYRWEHVQRRANVPLPKARLLR